MFARDKFSSSDNGQGKLNVQKCGYTPLVSVLTILVATSTTSVLHVRGRNMGNL